MGMYTEIHYNAELRTDVPADIMAILKFLVEDGEEPAVLPEHPFFKCERWRFLATMDSYYFAADTHSTLRYDENGRCHYLCIRANLKNCGGEIESFVDWVAPYIHAIDGDFLGFMRYEEDDWPVLIHYPAKLTRTEALSK